MSRISKKEKRNSEQLSLIDDEGNDQTYSSAFQYDDGEEKPKSKCQKCLDFMPKRYVLATMTFLGFTFVYGMRINLSVALVDMVSNKSIRHHNTTTYVRINVTTHLHFLL